MGRLKSKRDYESIRNARILEIQARLAELGLDKKALELRLTAKSVRKYPKVDYGSTPRRCSARLKGITADDQPISPRRGKLGFFEEIPNSEGEEKRPGNSHLARKCRQVTSGGEEDCKRGGNQDMDQPCVAGENLVIKSEAETTGRLKTKSNYESIRNARILENQARLALLGLHKAVFDLRSMVSSVKTHVKKYRKVDYGCTPRRFSARLKGIIADPTPTTKSDHHISLRQSNRLRGTSKGKLVLSVKSEEIPSSEGKEKRPANAPLVRVREDTKPELSPDVLARRCASKSRGIVYHPVFGICCHFCRQKTLCGEEDCKRCANLDMDQPCIGKTDCSVCHSSNGVLCRACLKVRYGEEMEEVTRNKEWMCPHCIEDKGINPYWICNSSICLKKRKMAPTGIAIFKAREMGHRSVAHLLMYELQQVECR